MFVVVFCYCRVLLPLRKNPPPKNNGGVSQERVAFAFMLFVVSRSFESHEGSSTGPNEEGTSIHQSDRSASSAQRLSANPAYRPKCPPDGAFHSVLNDAGPLSHSTASLSNHSHFEFSASG